MSIGSFDSGTLINERYRLIELIGKGGMGQVWKAEDTRLDDRIVAIKFITWQMGDDAEHRERFRQEMQALARLDHANIVHLLEFDETPDDTPFLVMNFIPGGSLQERLEKGGLDADTRSRVLKELCDALDYIHSQNVVHRDLKPPNILFDASNHVRISDFGLAKLLDDTDEASVLGGTLGFMAPEQRAEAFATALDRGEKPRIDHRVDIYALGVIAWLLFTGQHPDDPISLPEDLLSPELKQALCKALAHERDDRYDLAGELLEAVNSAISLHRERILPALRRRLSPWVWGVAGVVILLLAVSRTLWVGRGLGVDETSDVKSTSFALTPLSFVSSTNTAVPTDTSTPTATAVTATPTAAATPAPSPSATPTATATPSPTPYARIIAGQLTVRAGPGENYQVLGEVRRGYQMPLRGRSEDGTWWQVDYLGWAGWIPAQPGGSSINPGDLPVVSTPPPPPFTLTPTPTPTAIPTPTATPTPATGMTKLVNFDFAGIYDNRIPGWRWWAYDNFTPGEGYDPANSFETPLFKQADDPARFINGATLQIDAAGFLKFKACVFQTVSVTSNARVSFRVSAGAYTDGKSIEVMAGTDPNGGSGCSNARWSETLKINQADGTVQLVAPEVVVGPAGRVTVCLYAEPLDPAVNNAAFFDDAQLIVTSE